MSSHRASRSPASAGESGAPPPSYQPERANLPTRAVVPEGPDYNQWIVENYGGGGGQYAYAQGGAMSGNVPFQQQQPPQSQLHHVAVPPPPQNQYNFVQEQYAPDGGASYDSHIVQNAADRPHRGLPATRISRRGGAAVNYPAVPQLRVPGAPPGPYQQSQHPAAATAALLVQLCRLPARAVRLRVVVHTELGLHDPAVLCLDPFAPFPASAGVFVLPADR
ncbi:hypothetical protein OH76DRAFT_915572 [Lentinus brumalis]|uniref:Uncharacterized protein n=1 Tax=Lentinus brumalis TaxID=2498619 RepID=A0A371D080_9APHY|nr:hypothetical protein OH76DRAFT_915572 [Polyporus brumalis]